MGGRRRLRRGDGDEGWVGGVLQSGSPVVSRSMLLEEGQSRQPGRFAAQGHASRGSQRVLLHRAMLLERAKRVWAIQMAPFWNRRGARKKTAHHSGGPEQRKNWSPPPLITALQLIWSSWPKLFLLACTWPSREQVDAIIEHLNSASNIENQTSNIEN